ncbi:MAG: hypothetical protein J5736_04515, partial [Bacilli bacterium]|nr:hypothetical protein [Bacilli bacterium]
FKRKDIHPTLSAIEDIGMSEEELRLIVMYFDRFSDDPASCFYDYSFEIEKKIEKNAQSRGAQGFVLIPELRGKRREIESFLSGPDCSEKA